jgi:hypothetical protein
MNAQDWAVPIGDAAAYARAGGRRRYHFTRRARAEVRRGQVAELLDRLGYRYGAQALIARRLGVSQATVSRDVRALGRAAAAAAARRCPACGRALPVLDVLDGLDASTWIH